MSKTISSQIRKPQGGKRHNLSGQLVFSYPHSKCVFLIFKINFLYFNLCPSPSYNRYEHGSNIFTLPSDIYAHWNSPPKPALPECKRSQLHCFSCKPLIILVVLQWTHSSMSMSLFYLIAQHWTHHPDVLTSAEDRERVTSIDLL